MPAGTLTITVSFLRSTPPPLHSAHLSLHHAPAPTAGRAGRRDHEDALVVRHLAAPAAGAARRRLRARPWRPSRCTSRSAPGASARAASGSPCAASRSVMVSCSCRSSPCSTRGAARAPPPPKPKPPPKKSANCDRMSSTPREALEAGLARAGVAVLIVELALLGIGEDLVGLGQLLEALLGRVVAGVAVGMALHRQPTVSLLDFGAFAAALEAQNLVIIALFDLHTGRRIKLISVVACVKAPAAKLRYDARMRIAVFVPAAPASGGRPTATSSRSSRRDGERALAPARGWCWRRRRIFGLGDRQRHRARARSSR